MGLGKNIRLLETCQLYKFLVTRIEISLSKLPLGQIFVSVVRIIKDNHIWALSINCQKKGDKFAMMAAADKQTGQSNCIKSEHC